MKPRTLLFLPLSAHLLAGCATAPPPTAAGVDWSREGSPVERLVVVTLVERRAAVTRRAGSTPKGYGTSKVYTATAHAAIRAARVGRDHRLTEVDAWPIEPLGVHCVVYRVEDDRPVDEVIVDLEGDPRVESVQPMQRFSARAAPAPAMSAPPRSFEGVYDDPYLPLQHALLSLDAAEAHRWATGSGVQVAVVDTWVDGEHPDLVGRVREHDFVGGPRSAPGTPESHGTAVAGIIASAANNGQGIVGVAPGVRVQALRACWQEGEGAACNSFTLARALAWVIDTPPRARVLNLSLAGPEDPLLARLIRRAVESGVVVLAAVDGEEAAATAFPASMPEVIGVAVPMADDGAGPGAGRNLPAPGADILTTLPGAAWDFLSGSSLAAAHASGVAALLLEVEPGLRPDEVAELLRTSLRPIGDEGVAVRSLNACVALASLRPAVACPTAGVGLGAGRVIRPPAAAGVPRHDGSRLAPPA